MSKVYYQRIQEKDADGLLFGPVRYFQATNQEALHLQALTSVIRNYVVIESGYYVA